MLVLIFLKSPVTWATQSVKRSWKNLQNIPQFWKFEKGTNVITNVLERYNERFDKGKLSGKKRLL